MSEVYEDLFRYVSSAEYGKALELSVDIHTLFKQKNDENDFAAKRIQAIHCTSLTAQNSSAIC